MQKSSIIVTGATGSMGRAAVRALAAKGERVIAVCRSNVKGTQLIADILSEFPDACVELALVDLSSIKSVRKFCDSLDGREIKGLFNNAGTLLRDYSQSKDGFEMCVAVNYIAPFILTNRIGAMMQPGGHIVNMVSLTCKDVKLNRHFFDDGAAVYSQLGTYAKSKLALMMFTMEYARFHPELHVNVSDPGIVNSNMLKMGRWFDPLADVLFRPFTRKPEKGVSPALRALETDVTGRLFVGGSIKDIPEKCRRFTDVEWLWNETSSRIEKMTKHKFYIEEEGIVFESYTREPEPEPEETVGSVVDYEEYRDECQCCKHSVDDDGVRFSIGRRFVTVDIDKLRKQGVPEYVLKMIEKSDEKVSTLRITRSARILLTDYKIEIKMPPLDKALYFLYLRHPEGIRFKDLSDHREELLDLYASVFNKDDNALLEESINALVNPLNNSVNEKCSRIKRAFTNALSPELAKHYYIDGKSGEPKSIALDRILLDWETILN